MNNKINIKAYEVICKSVTRTLQIVGDRLCNGNPSDKDVSSYDEYQQRLSDIAKTIADIKVSKNVPEFVYIKLGIELNTLHNDIKLFASRCR